MFEVKELNSKSAMDKQNKPQWTRPLILTVIASSLGTAVPSGYCSAVLNSPAIHIRSWCRQTLIEQYDWHLSDASLSLLWTTIVSISVVAGMIGSFCGGRLADRLGRSGVTMLCGFLFLISAIGFYSCRMLESVSLLVLCRFVAGIATGITTTCLPMYHSEIAADSQRGTLSVGLSLGFTMGTVLGQLISLEKLFGGTDLWHFALSGYVVLIAIVFVPYSYYPESPKFMYIVQKKRDETYRQLKRLRGNVSVSAIAAEMHGMEFEATAKIQASGFATILSDRRLFMPMMLLFTIMGGQQLSGIGSVYAYSDAIFRRTGIESEAVQWLNLGTGVISLASALLSPMLLTIFKRRTLLITSSISCAIFLISFALMENNTELVNWFNTGCIASLYLFIIGYQLGLSSIPSFIGTELFEVSQQSSAMSLGGLVNWSCAFIVTMTFPHLHSLFGSWTFLLFAFFCILLSLITKFILPETKGRSTTETAELLSHGFKQSPK